MKVVYIYSSLAIRGGIERVLVDKMNYLVGHYGYEVYIITSDQGQHMVPYNLDERVVLYDLQIRFHCQYNFHGWKRIRVRRALKSIYHHRLKEKLDEIQPDVILCTAFQDVRKLLHIKGDIPLIVESHFNYTHPESWISRFRTLRNNCWIGKADAVVTLTQGDAEKWKRVSQNVHVIPNIVHLNDTGHCSDCVNKRAIFVGRLVDQKGLPDLIKIWQVVNQRYPDWQLDVYGDGKMNSIPEMKLFVHPSTSNIMEEYINSSMLLMTSVYEPFGLVLPEAMSCGLPVVAFDCPYGPAEIITDGIDGYVIRNRNVEYFANQVCQLIESKELRIQIGRAGIHSVQRFSAERIMPVWKELFSSL